MKDQRYFWNVLRVASLKQGKEIKHLEEICNMPVRQPDTPEEHLVFRS